MQRTDMLSFYAAGLCGLEAVMFLVGASEFYTASGIVGQVLAETEGREKGSICENG